MIITCFISKLPSFKHGDNIVNESYAACFYLEVSQLRDDKGELCSCGEGI